LNKSSLQKKMLKFTLTQIKNKNIDDKEVR